MRTVYAGHDDVADVGLDLRTHTVRHVTGLCSRLLQYGDSEGIARREHRAEVEAGLSGGGEKRGTGSAADAQHQPVR